MNGLSAASTLEEMSAVLQRTGAMLALVLALVVHAPAQAHKPSDSYLTITLADGAIFMGNHGAGSTTILADISRISQNVANLDITIS